MPATKTKRAAAAPARGALAEVEQFLFHEARLLDQGRLDEWLGLFTDDATYWVPLEANQTDPLGTVSIIYDDRRLLTVRVRQFRHPRAHARVPATRTVHQVGNVQILADDGREVRVASTLVMIEYRNERQRVWGALVEHRLRRVAGGFRIAAKRVDLSNSESELDGIACLF
jgi:benzoate/toluate 1,2-dioxygenase beta subunit